MTKLTDDELNKIGFAKIFNGEYEPENIKVELEDNKPVRRSSLKREIYAWSISILALPILCIAAFFNEIVRELVKLRRGRDGQKNI